MKAYLAILILLIATHCKDMSKGNTAMVASSNNCPAYFQFDQMTHYRISISDNSVGQIQERKDRNDNEEKLVEVLNDRFFDEKYSMTSLTDTLRLMSLEKLGFTKKEISNDKFAAINSLFCERKTDEIERNMCSPIYRDIIFFRKQNKTVGFARICLDCDMSNIVGSDRDTYTFGQAGEFELLETLLE